MVVITMAKITSLTKKLQASQHQWLHLSRLTFHRGETFGWDHTACAISFNPRAAHAEAYLLHEFGHAALNHADYQKDIELIQMERAAWDMAIQLGAQYGVVIDEDLVEDSLDTYRDWLHSRSLCPTCNATGIEATKHNYVCLACHHSWRVNEARTCALRRYPTKKRLV